MKRYICIHGHFYQPPRENPWLESIEVQDSAYPYHDWNERITAESYGPNATSRILDEEDRIVSIQNNYSRMSYNFGPTLLAWMKDFAPRTYGAVLEADKISRSYYSGHGSAMAQVYNHIIMPLANRRDKETQVLWGKKDFIERFGRDPEGMWLAETAVDTETLEVLAEHGIRFTVLAPHQADKVRKLGSKEWETVGGAVDPKQAYVAKLPSGKSINLFFYDGPISQAVAFEGLLNKGEYLAERLMGAFDDEGPENQLVHIATDGETYGHHHRYGDMALAYALKYIDEQDDFQLTNYAEFLELHPPQYEVQISEKSAWSCAHGVERWRSNCGCASGMNAGWNQEWRSPLRQSLDWLRDSLNPTYEAVAGRLFKDPWAARNDYVEVILNRSPASRKRFFEKHAAKPFAEEDEIKALKLLEMQRHMLLMYTSCGWFFDEISGIETVQVIQYAARVLQLAHEVFEEDFETRFLEIVGKGKSNLPQNRNGRFIYEQFAKPAMTDLYKVGAHYAMTSLFDTEQAGDRVYCYRVEKEDYRTMNVGRAKLALAKATITSLITRESARMTLGVLHFGDHNVLGGVRTYRDEESYEQMTKEVVEAFSRADYPDTIRKLDSHFGALTYSLKSLFHDEQRRIIDIILESTRDEAESSYRQIYEYHAPLLRYLTDLHVPLPSALLTACAFIINVDLARSFEAVPPPSERIKGLLEEAQLWKIELNSRGLAYVLEQTLERLSDRLADAPTIENLDLMQSVAGQAFHLPFEVTLWEAQNAFVNLLDSVHPEKAKAAERGDADAKTWLTEFTKLADLLRVKL